MNVIRVAQGNSLLQVRILNSIFLLRALIMSGSMLRPFQIVIARI